MNTQNRILLVISGPSGVGKSELKNLLMKRLGGLYFSVSATARPARKGAEQEGKDYTFVTRERFMQMVEAKAFLEHADVHGNLYGTPNAPIQEAFNRGDDVLLEIDTQGAMAVRGIVPDCVTVFILPPSYAELEKRLRDRKSETAADIQRRLQNARIEISQVHRYDYAIINSDRAEACEKLASIIIAERQNTARYHPTIEEGVLRAPS